MDKFLNMFYFIILMALLFYTIKCIIENAKKQSSIDSKKNSDSNAYESFDIIVDGADITKIATCPKCHKSFTAHTDDFRIKKNESSNDVGYIVCQNCNSEIPISKYHLSHFGYKLDNIGNIVKLIHFLPNQTVYQTTCPECSHIKNYTSSKMQKDDDGKYYIICDKCTTKIKLNKLNTIIKS